MVRRDNNLCPSCQSKNIVPIQYGYPTPEAVEDSKKNKVHFGGCTIDVFNHMGYYVNLQYAKTIIYYIFHYRVLLRSDTTRRLS